MLVEFINLFILITIYTCVYESNEFSFINSLVIVLKFCLFLCVIVIID